MTWMSPIRIYRFSIWLPILVPIALIVVMNVLLKGFGMPKPSGALEVMIETLAGSAFIAGLPYAALAFAVTRWMRDRDEIAIRRLMLVAPALMVGVWFVWCLALYGLGGNEAWLRIALWGAGLIIPIGYGYVALTILLRWWLGPRSTELERTR